MAKPKKTVKCVYCSKEVEVLPKGTVKPHLVHKGKDCIGGGAKAHQMALHRDLIDKMAAQHRRLYGGK